MNRLRTTFAGISTRAWTLLTGITALLVYCLTSAVAAPSAFAQTAYTTPIITATDLAVFQDTLVAQVAGLWVPILTLMAVLAALGLAVKVVNAFRKFRAPKLG